MSERVFLVRSTVCVCAVSIELHHTNVHGVAGESGWRQGTSQRKRRSNRLESVGDQHSQETPQAIKKKLLSFFVEKKCVALRAPRDLILCTNQ